jgi:hypothetical protein
MFVLLDHERFEAVVLILPGVRLYKASWQGYDEIKGQEKQNLLSLHSFIIPFYHLPTDTQYPLLK